MSRAPWWWRSPLHRWYWTRGRAGLYRARTRLLSRFGHWMWEHEFKTCPSGERHCPHTHYRLGRAKDPR